MLAFLSPVTCLMSLLRISGPLSHKCPKTWRIAVLDQPQTILMPEFQTEISPGGHGIAELGRRPAELRFRSGDRHLFFGNAFTGPALEFRRPQKTFRAADAMIPWCFPK